MPDVTGTITENPLINTALNLGLNYLMGGQGQGMTQGMGMGTGIGTLANQFGIGDIMGIFGYNQPTQFLGENWPEGLRPYEPYIVKEPVQGREAEYDSEGRLIREEVKPQAGVQEWRTNPLYPITGGMIAHEYAKRQPRDELPMDQTGITIPQTAQAAIDDPNLRFKPIESARAAQGGRIGYQNAGDVEIPEVDTEGILKKLENFRKKRQDYEDAIFRSKRIEAQEGGLMNLGGMEKDYRQEGGFVPIGAKEKADDVPARLSKNEFVFTADAVRAAGGGDIDEGAAVMERLMENLEAGGKVSEDSQGLEGAQAMFANTQKLQNRII
jgi:hypothetical protein